jgi:putative peptidoglycan lipid II flippase
MAPRQDPAGYPRDPELAPDLGYRQDHRRQNEPVAGYPGYGYPPDQGGQRTQPGYRQDYGYPPDQGGQRTQPGYPQGYGNPDEDGYPWPAQSYPSGAPAPDPETAPDLETVPAPASAPPAGGPSLARSSTVMALGTVASRLTGFLRTVVQVAALGTLHLADAYNNANTLPNVVYNLALGGILTSVIVPLLVNAAKRDADHGEAYDQRMFTLATMALLGVTVIATAAAVPLVYLYKGPIQGAELHILVIFAYFFIPQIFFYGVSSLAGAVLNARGHFAAPMWTPVVNNVVVIVVLLLFTVIAAKSTGPATITTGEVQLLGWGTTLGIVAQTAALLPALRRVGFRWRPRFDFRRAEVGEIRRMAGWMAGYVAATQAAFLVTSIVANTAGVAAAKAHTGYGAGFSAYTYGWLLFQLPYAVVGISVITALLPRMSAHATERRYAAVREDFSTGVRLSSVIVAPSALILAVLGAPLALVLFAHGRTGAADARYIGEVFAVFCLGLVPYMLFQLQLRVFYALHDSRTPALIGFGTATVNIITNLIALQVLPARQVVAGLGVGFGLANVFGTAVAWYILSRRLGGLDGRIIGGSLLRMHAAAIPPAIFALAVSIMVGAILSHGRLGALVTVTLAGAGALLLYVLFAKALGVSEVTDLTGSVRARLRR